MWREVWETQNKCLPWDKRQFTSRSSEKTHLSKLRLALKKRQLDKYMRRAVWSVCTAATKQPRKKERDVNNVYRVTQLSKALVIATTTMRRIKSCATRSKSSKTRQGKWSHLKMVQVKSGTGQWWHYSRSRRWQKLLLLEWQVMHLICFVWWPFGHHHLVAFLAHAIVNDLLTPIQCILVHCSPFIRLLCISLHSIDLLHQSSRYEYRGESAFLSL